MLAYLADPERMAEYDEVFIGAGELPTLRAALAALPPGKQPTKRWDFLCKIAMTELRLGQTEAAVAGFKEACDLHPQLAGKMDPEALRKARFHLALSWLRLGENANCVARHTSESCLVPIGPKGVHLEQQGSSEALRVLLALLAEDPQDLPSRWLLNLAAMTVGEYPQAVPKAHLIPPAAFSSDESFPRFVDVAPELGLNSMTLSGGVIVDDFDGDDVLDIVASESLPTGQLLYFKGHRDGTFTDRTEAAGLTGIVGGLNAIQTDYDNDGFLDIHVPRGAWLFERGRIHPSLLHNDGDGTFTDVTFAAGLAEENYPTQAVAWADYDNDGDLDLYVANESSPRIAAPSQLFRNDGDGTFTDVAKAAGVLNNRYAKGVAFGDYDGDRFPDLYVSNLELNRLYRNQGDGTFADVAEALGVVKPERSFPTWFFDYDNDGVLDIYVATFLPRLGPYVLDLLGGESNAEFACLYKGDGRGGFREVAKEVGLDEITVTMGANFGDLDNDGYLDFYLNTGFPDYEALIPSKMYWNRGGKKFADVTTAGGFGHLQKGHGVAFADLDRDGDQDVFAEMGGAFPGDAFGNALFRNPGFGNHWVTVKLVGVRSNRPGIGARIRCEITENGVKRSVYKHVNSGGSFGANPLRQMIGLGKATGIGVLEVYWPTSDLTQTFRDVPVDAAFEITEGEAELRRIE
ncbi:MAG: CRTAC1 family protein [Planctomycetes bacterium]|nr:CRTAC1 family protein [Planctomycetota bacterium]